MSCIQGCQTNDWKKKAQFHAQACQKMQSCYSSFPSSKEYRFVDLVGYCSFLLANNSVSHEYAKAMLLFLKSDPSQVHKGTESLFNLSNVIDWLEPKLEISYDLSRQLWPTKVSLQVSQK